MLNAQILCKWPLQLNGNGQTLHFNRSTSFCIDCVLCPCPYKTFYGYSLIRSLTNRSTKESIQVQWLQKLKTDWTNCKQTKAKQRMENRWKGKIKKMRLGIECTMDTKWERDEKVGKKLEASKSVPPSSIT